MSFISDTTKHGNTFTDYLAAGLCALPAIVTEKRPAIGSWKSYQSRLPTQAEASDWNRIYDAVCIICGKVSGALEMIDFDCKAEWYGRWAELVESEAPGLLARLVVEQSQRGGKHVVYRAPEIPGNMKLARRATDKVTMIETRGEGGLFLCAPSPGYELLQGDFAHIPTLTMAEHQILIDAAESLNEVFAEPEPTPTAAKPAPASSPRTTAADSTKPGDDFNVRGDVRGVLVRHGWVLEKDGPNQFWRRPRKDHGTSATLKDGCFYVHSSNAAPFEAGKGYAPFAVYTLLEHGGDYAAAARALRQQGYGSGHDGCAAATGYGTQGVDLSGLMGGFETQAKSEEPAAPAAEEQVAFAPINFAAMDEQRPERGPAVIDGIVREGAVATLVSGTKGRKSWSVGAAVAAGLSGGTWFGYPVKKCRVAIIDGELTRGTIYFRLRKVFESLHLDPATFVNLDIYDLRGRTKEADRAIDTIRAKGPGYYGLVCIDPLYCFYPPDPRFSENDNACMRRVYDGIIKLAGEIRAAILIVHHLSKGDQSGKSIADLGSGAGAVSRAGDAHIAFLPHAEKDAVVFNGIVRDFPELTPSVWRWSFPTFTPAPDLDPEDLKQAGSNRRTKIVAKAAKPAEPTPVWNASTFADAFVGPKPVQQKTIIAQAREIKLGKAQAENLVLLGLGQGKIYVWKVKPSIAIFLANTPQPEANAL